MKKQQNATMPSHNYPVFHNVYNHIPTMSMQKYDTTQLPLQHYAVAPSPSLDLRIIQLLLSVSKNYSLRRELQM